VLIFTGIALALGGAIVAILGLGGVTAFEGTVGDVEVKTESVGLAIMVAGAVLAATVALKLPSGVRVLAGRRTIVERIAGAPWIFVAAALLGSLLLVLSLILD
jgi:hypothetical protein